ncbi:MAG: 4-alpha-glucanotransferase [Spirochaetales bacterium]|nr:MAG: 4-alpha-glucanotransferase [Spirochaetales bacterium]
MQFLRFSHPVTGVVIPLSAIRSSESTGIGEFADLVPLARWASALGIELIQILPVNDTAAEPSPYSALSAFALHPVYARLQDFPEFQADQSIREDISALRLRLDTPRLHFREVLEGKLEILKKLWAAASPADLKLAGKWAEENTWVYAYSLFSLFRENQQRRAWYEWEEHNNPSEKDIRKLWKKHRTEAGFWVWLQWRLEEQFLSAGRQLDAMGVALKGDIPILINADSADVWAERDNFRLDFRAGAPPDALSADGQNWGFPTYNWSFLRGQNFRWWRSRLSQASKFYHAYRIDHVLGFFRIWSIPENSFSALNGRYDPVVSLKKEELIQLGFDEGRITWLSLPHFPGEDLRITFGEDAPEVARMLTRVGTEDLWRAEAGTLSEKDVAATSLSSTAKKRLNEALRDRTLIPLEDGTFLPHLDFRNTRAWHTLSDTEREGLERLINRAAEDSEELWAENARELLTMMKGDGSMLVCAEDLGVVPRCVPGVLKELGILSLKVTRWTRFWEEENQPYEPPSEYPPLSVTTSSVHDASTLRSWLAEETEGDTELRKLLGVPEDSPLEGSEGIRLFLETLQDGASYITAYPVQDILALDESCVSANPADERINIPGTVQEKNWSWRMELSLEELAEKKKLSNAVKKLCERRRTRCFTPDTLSNEAEQ